MSFNNDKINDLKLKLQSATRRYIKNRKIENSLRYLERTFTEDISMVTTECDFILQQMQDLKNQIVHALHQISITQIYNVLEKCKIENHLSIINAHKQGFEVMFARERKISELHNKELAEKEAEQEAIERQKIAEILEINEQKGKEAAAVESECEAIERECNVLTKRNKAMMLKLRRKLIDAEDTRREMMKKNG